MHTADPVWRAHGLWLAGVLTLVLMFVTERRSAEPAEDVGAAGEVANVTLTEFAIEPASMQVPAGVPVRFNVTNQGTGMVTALPVED